MRTLRQVWDWLCFLLFLLFFPLLPASLRDDLDCTPDGEPLDTEEWDEQPSPCSPDDALPAPRSGRGRA